MKTYLILILVVCGLLSVFPVDSTDQHCPKCTSSGDGCSSCLIGCYLDAGWCHYCKPNCVTCSSSDYCDECKPGYYGPTCEHHCVSCRDGSCTNNVCTNGCADGYYLQAEDGNCLRCPNTCVTCNINSDCTSCITGPTGSYCQNCNDGYYLNDGKCSPCKTNCLYDKCFNYNGGCENGCKHGWSGWRCNDSCSTTCDTCERYNTSACTYCSLDSTGSNCTEAEQDARASINAAVIGGVVGSALVAIVVIAVLVLVFLRHRRNMSDPEKKVTFDNSEHIVNIEDDTDTDDSVYSVAYKRRSVNENVDKTQSTAHSTLPKLTPSEEPFTVGDDIYGDLTDVPVIPYELDVDEHNNNVGELSSDEVNSGGLKDAYTPNAEDYYNISEVSRSQVEVIQLRDHVASISTEAFEKEFIKLPKGLTRPYGDAIRPTNVSKNRYKGIFPYDSTRVKLTGIRGDYINASYIQGFEDSENTYIASSGPAEIFMSGYVEFWEMVWQEKVNKIVMLTNFVEGLKMKCEKYWPDVGENKTYGDISVHCMSDEKYADFTVTKLTIKKDSKVMNIHHFHLTSWPDQGTPENVVSLVEFRESVEQTQTTTEGPIVVHCSAGVGRTGTYIAFDILTREGQCDNHVDVYGCVLALRGQRVLMVQTVEQYRFLHYALSYSLTNKCDQILSKDFCTVETDEIQEQFQLLGTVQVLNCEEEMNAIEKNEQEIYKNRNGASVPGDAHRPRLFKYNQKSKSDYINAIYVDGYKEKNRYIIAQTPLSETVEDFLGLVLQENCSCIISLDPLEFSSKQDIGDFLPDVNQELSVGRIKISCLQREITAEYILSKLTLEVQEESTEEPRTILHYQYIEWSDESPVPSFTGSFLNLVQLSGCSVREPNMPLKPVLIHCLNGVDRSGLFPIVANILEKIDSEQQASIVNVVSQVRSRRPRAIPNKEQFKFCYELASLFVENNSVYSNLL